MIHLTIHVRHEYQASVPLAYVMPPSQHNGSYTHHNTHTSQHTHTTTHTHHNTHTPQHTHITTHTHARMHTRTHTYSKCWLFLIVSPLCMNSDTIITLRLLHTPGIEGNFSNVNTPERKRGQKITASLMYIFATSLGWLFLCAPDTVLIKYMYT